ncbi:GTP-binding nuclear protein spi1 [Sphaceloma murrayae]|uniref:GTP-binding nuclear protein spi1 n=1 Tax=Sphaceloma murrayae TaxID=2082308 RepID=A0A2K1QFF5_9PEZI|nr:GTP-binding nuclear protein spi1 [Sphaceloma murrayae]
MSTQGHTLYPYCQFLRVLDLRDLYNLLDDDKFRGKTLNYFFSGPLKHLHMIMDTPVSRKGPRRPRLNIQSIVLSIADSITKQAIKLEELTEPVAIGVDLLPNGLKQWSPRLRHLQVIQLSDGKALADYALQDLLISSCPLLHRVEIYRWMNDDRSDTSLARFFSKLPPNTLTEFQNESECGIGPAACEALSTHAKSLTALHLAIGRNGIPGLGKLKPLTSLQSLALTDLNPPNDLETTQNDVFTDLITWLQSLPYLTTLQLVDFISAPSLLAAAFQNLSLTQLQINGSDTSASLYPARESQAFHLALRSQTTLQSLSVAAEADGTYGDDVNLITESLCHLTQLKILNLTKLSEFFTDQHIVRLCNALPSLEELVVDGYDITDVTVGSLHKLRNLRSITFSGMANFSFEAMMAWIRELGEGNEGLAIDVVNPRWEGRMSEEEVEMVRALLRERGGRLGYEPVGEYESRSRGGCE